MILACQASPFKVPLSVVKDINSNEIKLLAERGFDPRTSGLWAQHASTAPLCYDVIILISYSSRTCLYNVQRHLVNIA